MAKTKLEVNNLRLSFWTNNGTVKAVRDISFDVKEGETLALVGESGSGKSVTSRAIMGILAGNAIVEGGEIFYDGMDLLQIPEEEYNKLRGNRISMIFQDPLSSLNPIMKVGQQITEAMIANNKSRKKSAKEELARISDGLRAVSADAGTDATFNPLFNKFNTYIETGNRVGGEYSDAINALETVSKQAANIRLELLGDNDPKDLAKFVDNLIKDSNEIYSDFTIDKNDKQCAAIISNLEDARSSLKKGNKLSDAELRTIKSELDPQLKELQDLADSILAKEDPNFMVVGYALEEGKSNINENYNSPALAKEFEDKFLKQVVDSIAVLYEFEEMRVKENSKSLLTEIEEIISTIKSGFDVNYVTRKTNFVEKETPKVLNRIAILRDSFTRTFDNSVNNHINNYKETQVTGRKQKRSEFERTKLETRSQENILSLYERFARSLAAKISSNHDYKAEANDLIEYLNTQVADASYTLTQSLAKSRAISLMDEVGINEPRKRFEQYPFEFSGGMRQRVVIAIALSSNPDLLICDEPTTALDVTIQAQILDLIKDLKKNRNFSVIFITHDLGVVANIADKIAVMYAGKIVEYGTVDEIFYEPAHPYTWGLLSSMPDLDTTEKLVSIPGTPPNMIKPPVGDAFAPRNRYALAIDFEEEPPVFDITETHSAATWLLHEKAPKVEPPRIVTDRIERMTKVTSEVEGA